MIQNFFNRKYEYVTVASFNLKMTLTPPGSHVNRHKRHSQPCQHSQHLRQYNVKVFNNFTRSQGRGQHTVNYLTLKKEKTNNKVTKNVI